jgi:L-alanine-DL-glutamate epimerase-like enolase superfamily enzyme
MGVNVKLVKCGVNPGRRMIQQAKALGLKTMVGCMTESSVGISAIAHLLPGIT